MKQASFNLAIELFMIIELNRGPGNRPRPPPGFQSSSSEDEKLKIFKPVDTSMTIDWTWS